MIITEENVIDGIIADMTTSFKKGVFASKTTFYFDVDGDDVTAILDADSYSIEKGKSVAEPDCVCKTSAEMFRSIWFEGYRPGIMDFIGGKIKTNNPLILQQFLQAFGK